MSAPDHENTDANSRISRTPATYGLAGALVFGYLAQNAVLIVFGREAFLTVWVLQSGAAANAWTWVLHLFAHGSATALVANLAWLLVFGRPIERAVGKHRFAGVFLGTGIVSGLIGIAILTVGGITGGLVGSSSALLAVLSMAAPFNPRLVVGSRSVPYLFSAIVVGLALIAVFELLAWRIASSSPWIVGIAIGVVTGLWLQRSGTRIDQLRLV